MVAVAVVASMAAAMMLALRVAVVVSVVGALVSQLLEACQRLDVSETAGDNGAVESGRFGGKRKCQKFQGAPWAAPLARTSSLVSVVWAL